MKYIFFSLFFSVNALAVQVVELKGVDHHLQIVNELKVEMESSSSSLKMHNLLVNTSIAELTFGAETNAEGIGKANIVIAKISDSLNLHPLHLSDNIWEDFEYSTCDTGKKNGENVIESLILNVNSLCSTVYEEASCQSSREEVTLYRENQLGKKDICFGVSKSRINITQDSMIVLMKKLIKDLKVAKDFFLSKDLQGGNGKLQKVYDSLIGLKIK